jgi:hypothetical protein
MPILILSTILLTTILSRAQVAEGFNGELINSSFGFTQITSVKTDIYNRDKPWAPPTTVWLCTKEYAVNMNEGVRHDLNEELKSLDNSTKAAISDLSLSEEQKLETFKKAMTNDIVESLQALPARVLNYKAQAQNKAALMTEVDKKLNEQLAEMLTKMQRNYDQKLSSLQDQINQLKASSSH